VSYHLDAQLSNASAVRTTCQTVWTHFKLKHLPSGRRGFPSGPSSCREASNCSSLHPSERFTSPSERSSMFYQASGFLSKTQIREDCCNHPDDVDSRPDALIHKASIAIQIQTSERQSTWSGRASIKYENCVYQIDRPDSHPPGPDERSLYMEITCSGRTTVRTTVHHRPDAALKQERSSTKFSEFRSHSCPSEWPMTTVRTAPIFIKPDAHLNCQPINRGP
jgi:hypothetical protein